MSWMNLLAGLANVGGAIYASNQNQRAAGQAAQGQQGALDLQAQMYNQNRADLAPYRQTGGAALQALAGQVGQGWGPGSPGYDFQFNEGQRALQQGLTAQGLSGGGVMARAAQRFGQGLAAQSRGDELNRLAALAGVGQTATAQGVGAAQGYANAGGQALANAGMAQAQGTTAAAQPWMQAAGNLYSWAMSPQGQKTGNSWFG